MELQTLQDELIGRLQGFINGDTLTAASRLMFPLVSNNINNFNRLLYSDAADSMLELLQLIEQDNNCYFKRSMEILQEYSSEMISSSQYAVILCTLYQELELNLAKDIVQTKVRANAIYNYDEWYQSHGGLTTIRKLLPVYELHDFLIKNKKYFHSLILHGSCSTLECNNFSDIDFLAVLNKQTIENPIELVEARNVIVKARMFQDLFNPLNHHGFLVLTEMDLKYYHESYMAVAVYTASTVFLGNKEIEFGILPESKINEEYRNARLKRKFDAVLRQPKTMYDLFDKISAFLLLPTLILARQKQFVFKADSFDLIKNQMTPEEAAMLSSVEQARNDWNYKPFFSYRLRKFWHRLINPLIFKFIMQNTKHLNGNTLKSYEKVLESINTIIERRYKTWGKDILKE